MMMGYRNGMVGNWYEPYRIDYSDAISTLEDTYCKAKTRLNKYASYEEIAKMAEEVEGNYDE